MILTAAVSSALLPPAFLVLYGRKPSQRMFRIPSCSPILSIALLTFYWERTNHSNGLMADRWSTPSSCSITGTGFALTAWPIGVERGWISRNQARDITLRTLRFFEQLPQGEQRSGTAGYRGFYYHFIDMETGVRLRNWDWELSTIDTTWLQMGMAFAQGWFDQEDEKEKEIRALVQRLLDRTEWDWMQANSKGGKASRWAGPRERLH